MKNILLIAFLFTNIHFINSQITINESDLPSVGDSLRYSIAGNYYQFDFTLTDTNMVWDFNNLSPADQILNYYESPTSAPLSYQITFNVFNTDMCINKNDFSLYGNAITDVYFYYNKSNSKFEEVGYGAKINDVPFPVTYDDNDVIFKYPASYGDSDSSFMSWDVTIPTIGYVSQKRHRNYEVDGWGTVKLPIGQYDCLRVKSKVIQIDSAYNQSFPIPLPAITSYYTEYYWITKTEKLPVLRVVIDDFSQETTVYYADVMQQFTGNKNITQDENIIIYPNPASDFINVKSKDKNYNLKIYNSNGALVKVVDKINKVDISNLSSGIYLIEVTTQNKRFTKKFIKE